MNHDDCRSSLIDHHFGELDEQANRAVVEHLSSCGECALEFCKLRADLGGLAPLRDARPSPNVRAALREKVQHTFGPSWFARVASMFSARVPLYQPAMALVLIVAIGVALWPIDDPPKRGDHTTVLDEFDASGLEIVDDRIL